MPNLTFTSGNDSYTVGPPGTYTLDFLGGDDTLIVNGGTTTTARMGTGNDLARLITGTASVFGDAGADKFDIWSSSVTVDGGADNDIINIRGGTGLTAGGGLGADHFSFYANTSGVSLDGGDGNDTFTGYSKAISGTLNGGDGNDFYALFGSGATLAGGLGNDVYRIIVGSVATLLETAGQGADAVQVSRGFSYTLPGNIEKLVVGSYFGSTTGSATLTGNALANTIVGWGNAESMSGLGGDDVLNAKDGNDGLNGGDGNDVLYGGLGDDTLSGGAGNDTLNGMGGTDVMAGGTGNDVYYVNTQLDSVTEGIGAGIDSVRVSITGYVLPDNVENGYLSGINIADLAGNDLNNLIVGSAGSNLLDGYGGNDTIKGGAGDDSLWGWEGNDTILGGAGADAMLGGIGNDNLNGGPGGDTMDGDSGDDTLTGADDNDSISGGDGSDFLDGGAGPDSLRGDAGSDTLKGGTGSDAFKYFGVTDSAPGAFDQITDFTTVDGEGADDQLDLSSIDANTAMAGDQAFNFSGPTPTANSLWYVVTTNSDGTSDWVFYGDVDGNTTADFEVHVHVTGTVFYLDDFTF